MKKLLSILGAVSLTALASTSVVACDKKEDSSNQKDPETLNGESFEVTLDSLSGEITDKQGQWGEKSIGLLWSTLWSINNKPAYEEYPLQNEEVAAFLTKGESINRGNDNGANVAINDTAIVDLIEEGQDWHTLELKTGDKVDFTLEIVTYKNGGEVNEKIPAAITITIA